MIQYDFTGAAGSQASTTASTVNADLSGIAFTRGSGLSPNAGANSINSSGWSTDGSTDYYDFGFTVTGGQAATVTQLQFGAHPWAPDPATLRCLRRSTAARSIRSPASR